MCPGAQKRAAGGRRGLGVLTACLHLSSWEVLGTRGAHVPYRLLALGWWEIQSPDILQVMFMALRKEQLPLAEYLLCARHLVQKLPHSPRVMLLLFLSPFTTEK